MKKKKTGGGLSKYREKYGYLFIAPWLVGVILFFLIPIAQSLYFAFCDIKLTENGLKNTFLGFDNFEYIINKDPKYLGYVMESFAKISYSLVAILVISLVLALILNSKFKGRIFFRALYFLPVIIASGVVIELLFAVNGEEAIASGVGEAVSNNMIDFGDVIRKLGLPTQISNFLSVILENIFEIVWNSGIQIILFISGLQSIPDQLYEAATVEGCTKWEEFWFVTLPMLSRTLTLVIVFTIVELLTTKTNVVMSFVLATINNLEYGIGAAMAWFYFLVIGVVMAFVMYILDRVWIRRWL